MFCISEIFFELLAEMVKFAHPPGHIKHFEVSITLIAGHVDCLYCRRDHFVEWSFSDHRSEQLTAQKLILTTSKPFLLSLCLATMRASRD